jgi:hypothetical protein
MPRARDRETPRQREARLRAEHRSAVASGEFGAAEAAAWDPMIELNRWDD